MLARKGKEREGKKERKKRKEEEINDNRNNKKRGEEEGKKDKGMSDRTWGRISHQRYISTRIHTWKVY